MTRQYPGWADDGQPRPLPPAQPPGWVDPPDEPRVPWSGWDEKPRTTERRYLVLAALIVAVAVLILQATRAKAEEPTSEVGTQLYSASATWCAPTPTQCQSWGGNARLAAVNSFTWGDEPYPVRVWRGDEYVDVTVVSHCACHGEDGYIDLSPAAFAVLAPLGLGRIDVAVEVFVDLPPHPDDDRMRVEDGGPAMPATDAAS